MEGYMIHLTWNIY